MSRSKLQLRTVFTSILQTLVSFIMIFFAAQYIELRKEQSLRLLAFASYREARGDILKPEIQTFPILARNKPTP